MSVYYQVRLFSYMFELCSIQRTSIENTISFTLVYGSTIDVLDNTKPLKTLQDLLREPIKFLKHPRLNTLAVSFITEKTSEIFVEFKSYASKKKYVSYKRISKDSVKNISKKEFFESL